MIEFTLNNETVQTDADPATPVLWVIRDLFGLKGSKFGCGMGLCGACTMHLDGTAVRSCVLPISGVEGRAVTTIEGIGTPASPSKVQAAWMALSVPQCGYCQPGQVMSAEALLASNPKPNDEDIDRAMSGNICRCGAYEEIRAAIHVAADGARNNG